MDEPILMGLEEACEEGERIEFRFRSGPEFQGWVEEIAADAIRVSWAPSPFYAQSTGTREDAPPPEWVRLVDIVPSSLAAWDESLLHWRYMVPDADQHGSIPPAQQGAPRLALQPGAWSIKRVLARLRVVVGSRIPLGIGRR